VLVAVAGRVGATRLIDNVTVDVTDRVVADLGFTLCADGDRIASPAEEQPCAAP